VKMRILFATQDCNSELLIHHVWVVVLLQIIVLIHTSTLSASLKVQLRTARPPNILQCVTWSVTQQLQQLSAVLYARVP